MNIGIYIYENAEVLDFSGPFEVFSTARRLAGNDWQVFLFSETGALVTARGGYLVQPRYSITALPPLEVLIVAGGVHDEEVKKEQIIRRLAQLSTAARITASVCTGAFLLAEAGLLDGLSATTHWQDIADLKARYPLVNVVENRRWVGDGGVVTAGGIAAGIDMSLSLVSQLASPALADQTARQMEYPWQHGG